MSKYHMPTWSDNEVREHLGTAFTIALKPKEWSEDCRDFSDAFIKEAQSRGLFNTVTYTTRTANLAILNDNEIRERLGDAFIATKKGFYNKDVIQFGEAYIEEAKNRGLLNKLQLPTRTQ